MPFSIEAQYSIDLDWFAVDTHGNIAHFASGGGKLPPSVAAFGPEYSSLLDYFSALPILNNEPLLNEKAITNDGECIPEEKKYLVDFMKMARRGLFSFDKTVLAEFTDTDYQLIVWPSERLAYRDLPEQIKVIIDKTRIAGSLDLIVKIDVATIP